MPRSGQVAAKRRVFRRGRRPRRKTEAMDDAGRMDARLRGRSRAGCPQRQDAARGRMPRPPHGCGGQWRPWMAHAGGGRIRRQPLQRTSGPRKDCSAEAARMRRAEIESRRTPGKAYALIATNAKRLVGLVSCRGLAVLRRRSAGAAIACTEHQAHEPFAFVALDASTPLPSSRSPTSPAGRAAEIRGQTLRGMPWLAKLIEPRRAAARPAGDVGDGEESGRKLIPACGRA